MTWAPNVPTEEEVEGFVEDLMAITPEILGIDETLPGCEVIDMDPYGVGAGTLPRYIQVAIREYYQVVYYRGFPAGLVATDFVTVIHLREGNRYEVLTAGGSGGVAHTVTAGSWLNIGAVANSLDFEPDNPAVITAAGVVTEYATIQAAITAAGAGEYVVVPPGTYDEAITLKNGVVVTELFPDTVVIDHTTSDVAVTTAAGGFLRVKEIRVTRANSNIRAVLSGHAAGICIIYARLIRATNAGTGGTIGVFQTGAGTLFVYCDDCQASGGDVEAIGVACDAGTQYLRGDCLAENGTANYSVGAECNGGAQRIRGDCRATDDGQVTGAYAVGAGDQIVRGHCTAETVAAGSLAVGAWTMNAGTVQVVYGECSGLAVDDARGAEIYQGTQTIHGNCFAECTGSPANSYGARVRADSVQTIWGNCTATGGTVSIGAYCQAWTGTPIQRVNGDVTGDFHGAACSSGTQTITNGRASGATADLERTGGTLQAFSVQHDTVIGTITWLDGDALESLRDYAQGSIIYGGAADWQDLVVGGIGDFLWVNAAGTEPEWHTLVAGDIPAHALLGAQHSDTTTDAPTRGSLIVANATPLWDELLHPLAAGYALITNATDTVWDQTPAWTGRHSFAAGITFNGGAGVNSVVIPNALADAFDITNGVEFLRLDTASDYFLIDPAGAGIKVAIGLATPNQVLTVEGTIDLKEQAAANPDTVAYGQIWVKDATPNELWFTDDTGTDVQLGVGGGALPPVAGAGYALISTGVNVWAADLTPLWLGTHTWGSGFSILPTDASGQDLGAAGARWDLYTQDVIFGGATGTNAITIPDNVADALHISDAGGIEYLKIITTDAQPILRFNDGGVDVDFFVQAVGVVDALWVQGSDGQITLGVLTAGYVKSSAGGVLSVATEVSLVDLGSYTQGDLIYGGAADWQDLAIGAIGDFLWVNVAGTEPEWHTLVAGDIPAHALLGTQHSDTTTDAPTRGSLIYANSTPLWDELVHPGAAGYALIGDATDIAWDQTPAWTGEHSFAAGIAFTGASGANETTVPDNTAIALELLDAGGLEYVRIVSTDANPYVLFDPANTGFEVILGATANPIAALVGRGFTVVRDAQAENNLFAFFNAGGGMVGQRYCAARGTAAAPAATQSGDGCFMGLVGYDGANFISSVRAYIGMAATQNWTAANQGSNITFHTCPNNSVARVQRMIIDQDGDIGMGTSGPAARAHVANETLANTSGQHTLYLTENNSTESATQAFDPAKPYFGVGFRRLWNGANATNVAGIYAYGSSGWKGGLVFRTKNGGGAGGAIDTTVMVMQPNGRIGMGLPGPLAQCHIDQASTTAAIPVLILDQADVSEGFINFIGSDRGIILSNSDSLKSVRVELGGVVYRLALYVDA